MGVTQSVKINVPDQSKLNYFTLQIGYTDRLRLILAPDEIVRSTEILLNKMWPVQDTSRSSGYVEFKLKDSPWTVRIEADVEVKYFICALLQEYYLKGWHLKTATDLQRNTTDTTVLVFQKMYSLKTCVISISLSSIDKIKVLGPENIKKLVKQVISRSWPNGIIDESSFKLGHEFKLNGNPWSKSILDAIDTYQAPIIVTDLLSTLFRNGLKFICAIDCYRTASSLNALYFRYVPNEITHDELVYTRFFSMSLNENDKLRLDCADQNVIDTMKSVTQGIPILWKYGIQNQGFISNSYEFRLKGTPWQSHKSESVESRKLISDILNLLSRNGYKLYATCDLKKSLENKATFFFKSILNETKPLKNFCLCLNESNKIRLIDSSSNVLVQQIRSAIKKGWKDGIIDEGDYHNSHQFKLDANPFQSSSINHVYVCAMMVLILQCIDDNGFNLLTTVDVSGKYTITNNGSYKIDLQSWFFESV